MSNEIINEKVLNSVGSTNYNEYMLLTEDKEINSILDNRSPVFEMYKYRDKLLNKGVGQNVSVSELGKLLKNNEDNELKIQLQNLFLDYINNNEFKIIKDMLVNYTFGWNIARLIEIHKKHKDYRIFRLLSIEYDDWLN